MSQKSRIVLPNEVTVRFFPKSDTLESMMEIARSKDFLAETMMMQEIGNCPPMNLLVYDDFLALGLFGENKLDVGISQYSPNLLLQYVDTALSLRHHPIRIIDKTSDREMSQRISPRTSLDWIEYDQRSQVIRENKAVQCPIDRYLSSAQTHDQLFTLSQEYGETFVNHWKIVIDGPAHQGLISEGQEIETFQDNMDNVESFIRQSYPHALVGREPLMFCGLSSPSIPYSCIGVKFERWYAERIDHFGMNKHRSPNPHLN
jgi:hypothetical protein